MVREGLFEEVIFKLTHDSTLEFPHLGLHSLSVLACCPLSPSQSQPVRGRIVANSYVRALIPSISEDDCI